MLNRIIEWDEELFLLLNGRNLNWLDPVMLVFSSYPCWIVSCAIMVLLIYLKDKSKNVLASLFFLVTIGVSALFTNVIKIIVGRPRPIHNLDWEGSIHSIEGYSDSFSFFSSHSATTFTMAVFFFLFYRTKRLYGWIAIIWATMVAYSRIYVAKHYPIDVLCGVVFGIFIGIVGYRVYEYYEKKDSQALAQIQKP